LFFFCGADINKQPFLTDKLHVLFGEDDDDNLNCTFSNTSKNIRKILTNLTEGYGIPMPR
jgi:hypothetical protein